MSIPATGVLGWRPGPLAAIGAELRKLNLKATTRVQVTFDPFHRNAKNCRDFLHYISASKILNTNPNCRIKTEIVCDRRDPTIVFKLEPELAKNFKLVNINAANLTCNEILKLYNKHVSILAPKEEDPEELAALQRSAKYRKGKKKK